jgi:hypothetical protein
MTEQRKRQKSLQLSCNVVEEESESTSISCSECHVSTQLEALGLSKQPKQVFMTLCMEVVDLPEVDLCLPEVRGKT